MSPLVAKPRPQMESNNQTSKPLLLKVPVIMENLAIYAFLSLIALTILYPIAWMIATSVKTQGDIFKTLTSLVPPKLYFGHYQELLARTKFLRYYFNSVLVTCISVLGLLLITSMAGYSFGRLKWRGKEAVYLLILAGQMIAPVAIIIPTFIIVNELHLVGGYLGVIVLYLSRVAFGILILRAFFEAIPREIEEAALLDGCSPYAMYWRVMLPLAMPAISSVGIFYFLFVWNDFLYPFLILQRQDYITLPVAIYNLKGRYEITWGTQTAALTMAVVPAVLAAVLFQKWIVRGLTAGALKD